MCQGRGLVAGGGHHQAASLSPHYLYAAPSDCNSPIVPCVRGAGSLPEEAIIKQPTHLQLLRAVIYAAPTHLLIIPSCDRGAGSLPEEAIIRQPTLVAVLQRKRVRSLQCGRRWVRPSTN
jgi:hypothetical protein